MPTILHFADSHIDMANYGRHDPQSGLPMRVVDFLKSLDTIVNTAIDRGIRYFDTADCYKGGQSERDIGTWLEKHPERRYTPHTP